TRRGWTSTPRTPGGSRAAVAVECGFIYGSCRRGGAVGEIGVRLGATRTPTLRELPSLLVQRRGPRSGRSRRPSVLPIRLWLLRPTSARSDRAQELHPEGFLSACPVRRRSRVGRTPAWGWQNRASRASGRDSGSVARARTNSESGPARPS